jgi:hypothetical protein
MLLWSQGQKLTGIVLQPWVWITDVNLAGSGLFGLAANLFSCSFEEVEKQDGKANRYSLSWTKIGSSHSLFPTDL